MRAKDGLKLGKLLSAGFFEGLNTYTCNKCGKKGAGQTVNSESIPPKGWVTAFCVDNCMEYYLYCPKCRKQIEREGK